MERELPEPHGAQKLRRHPELQGQPGRKYPSIPLAPNAHWIFRVSLGVEAHFGVREVNSSHVASTSSFRVVFSRRPVSLLPRAMYLLFICWLFQRGQIAGCFGGEARGAAVGWLGVVGSRGCAHARKLQLAAWAAP